MKTYRIHFKSFEFSLGDNVDPDTYPKKYMLTPEVLYIEPVEN